MNTGLANIPWNLVVPIIALEIILKVASLISLVRSEKVQRGTKPIWAVIIVVFSLIGSILYWTIGRDPQ